MKSDRLSIMRARSRSPLPIAAGDHDCCWTATRIYQGKGLRLQFTVEDEGVFTTQWSARIIYQRPLSPLGQWPQSVCADNPREYYTGKDPAVPTADTSEF
jgi:hypothetical protein